MKFYIKKENFINELRTINNVLIKNPIFPILENVFLNIDQDKFILIGSNIELEIQILIKKENYKLKKSGTTIVSGKKILNICRTAPSNSILFFCLIETKLHIRIINSLYKIQTLKSKDFPKFQVYDFKLQFKLKEIILRKIILFTHFSIAHNDIRNCLNGMLLEMKKNILYGVTTDGHRLSIYKKKINYFVPSFSIILSKKIVIELQNILQDIENKIKINIYNNNVIFEKTGTILRSKLIKDQYPTYNHIIIKNYKNFIILPLLKLKNSLIRSSILCDTNFQGVNITLKNNLLIIKTNNQEDEESKNYFKISYTGEIINFSINVYYLLDILNNIKSTMIKIIFEIPIKKIQIECLENKNIYYVIMPLKL